MSKSIHTLVPDIYELVQRKDGWFTDELAKLFAVNLSKRLQARMSEERSTRPRLRLSQMGPKCPCALWHSLHNPELAEKLPPHVEIKFTYGDMIEEFSLMLARAAGHTVEGEQDVVVVDGISGHRDCVIDGCLVDVKSASSRVFEKFKTGQIVQDDSFGYLDQLDGYLVGCRNDPLVLVKNKGYNLVIDKTLGKVLLYEHELRELSIRERIRNYKSIAELSKAPACTCGTEPHGKSGNIMLTAIASYNAYKFCCFPNLRTFLYSDGPVYLTKVERKPDVPEIDRNGNLI